MSFREATKYENAHAPLAAVVCNIQQNEHGATTPSQDGRSCRIIAADPVSTERHLKTAADSL
jgi:hypothetical protein